ncbi:hypothetical protein [Paremcibacter congregatus]|uniref:Uncharacterized protein n=1 Tax=Paremcibacter congregatus TaxID=2043170 RepID=A0A2G4YVT7_9PROT|nr:hypothetical protein [Paremcibacter congregatus]PHZ86451.1 hypothetical protein CRD36_00760 [Paremcibacter congregatus]QDE28452.1 hypothetical protein FIV45_14835 [Paremcibacter congregatus]
MSTHWKLKVWYWLSLCKRGVIALAGFLGFIGIALLLIYSMKLEPKGDAISTLGILTKAHYYQSDEGSKLNMWTLELPDKTTISIPHTRWWTIKEGDCVAITYREAKWTKRNVVDSLKKSTLCQ